MRGKLDPATWSQITCGRVGKQHTLNTPARKTARCGTTVTTTGMIGWYTTLIFLNCSHNNLREQSAYKFEHGIRYCLSYTALVLNLLPLESVPVVVTVRVRPLAETTIRPVKVTLPPFLPVNANVWLFIFRYDRMSEVGSPVTG